MKTRKKELDVDFIGGVGPLTKKEEERVSEVIKRLKRNKGSTRKAATKLASKRKVS